MLALCSAAVAGTGPAANRKVLTLALNQYLEVHGDLCLGKFDWPIDVSPQDFLDHTRDALQMPVLEKFNLVVPKAGTVKRLLDDGEQTVSVNQYALTAIGRIYYLERPSQVTLATGEVVKHNRDLCGGHVRLNKLVRWDTPTQTSGNWETTLHYTYTFTPVWWAQEPQVQQVFPVFPTLLQGQGKLQLEQRFQWTGKQWVPLTTV